MKIRYKKTGEEGGASQFNVHAMAEVLTGDDSAYISDLDVWIEGKGWVDMGEAFRNHDLIVDDYNTRFFEPRTEEDRKRGYAL